MSTSGKCTTLIKKNIRAFEVITEKIDVGPLGAGDIIAANL